MEYLNPEDTFTVSEALQSVGCGLEIPDGYKDTRLAKGPLKFLVNPDGRPWVSCSGSVLFGWNRVYETDNKRHQGKFYKSSSSMYVVIEVRDGRWPFLKIVFSA